MKILLLLFLPTYMFGMNQDPVDVIKEETPDKIEFSGYFCGQFVVCRHDKTVSPSSTGGKMASPSNMGNISCSLWSRKATFAPIEPLHPAHYVVLKQAWDKAHATMAKDN